MGKGLIHFWKKYGHGNLIGTSHSTVAYWYLMYFNDERTLLDSSKNRLPKPNRVAINGNAMSTSRRRM